MVIKYSFMTLKKEPFSIEADSDIMVSDLVQKISDYFEGRFQKEKIKIVCMGKLFSNSKKMSEYSFDYTKATLIATEVLMDKMKDDKKNVLTPEVQPTNQQPNNHAPPPQATLNDVNYNTNQLIKSNEDFFKSQNFLALPEPLRNTIKNITELGFPVSSVINSLHIANYNPDMAVDILMGGDLPANEYNQQLELSAHKNLNPMSNAVQNSQASTVSHTSGKNISGVEKTSNNNLPVQINNQSNNAMNLNATNFREPYYEDYIDQYNYLGHGEPSRTITSSEILNEPLPDIITNNNQNRTFNEKFMNLLKFPYMPQIASACKNNPTLLANLMDALRKLNDGTFDYATAHPEEFIDFINNLDILTYGTTNTTENSQNISTTQTATNSQISNQNENRMTVSVTESERDSIKRLVELGFPEDQVVQVYFACDKNENLAANILFKDMDK